ncbi:MAG: gluconate 2-dehydrogenase subunit 3 family protein [Cellulomonas sp.]
MSERFPGFDVTSQAEHWDDVTARVVLARLDAPGPLRFFSAQQAETCAALVTQLLALEPDNPVPVMSMIDARLADGQTDGWRYADLPPDDITWVRSLDQLDEDSRARSGTTFARSDSRDQAVLIDAVQRKQSQWPGLPAGHVWSLWTRYACTAYYSHPFAFSEIGFPGPAYPRGYKNIGIDRREPFEVADVAPHDPVPGDS